MLPSPATELEAEQSSGDWKTYMAMHKRLSQAPCLPQSTPTTPTQPQLFLSSLHKRQSAADLIHHTSTPITASQQQNSPPTQQLPTSCHLSAVTNGFSIAGPTPCTAASPLTMAAPQIPTSLQRLVQSNLSATSGIVPSSRGPSPSESSHSSPPGCSPARSCSPPRVKATNIVNTRPDPLSISSTTMGKSSDDFGPTPLTPLSPYCGQQGRYPFSLFEVVILTTCVFIGRTRCLMLFFQFKQFVNCSPIL